MLRRNAQEIIWVVVIALLLWWTIATTDYSIPLGWNPYWP